MKKMICKVIMISLTISSLSLADDPILLHKNDKAPMDGLLFSEQKSSEVKTKLIEGAQLQLLNDSLNKSISLYKNNEDIYSQKIDLLQKQNDSLAQKLYDQESSNFWKSFAFFSLGVVASGITLYGLKQISK